MSEIRNGEENNHIEAQQQQQQQQQQEDEESGDPYEAFVLETEVAEIHLDGLADNLSEIHTFSLLSTTPIIEEFIEALQSTTTVQELRIVWFSDGLATAAHERQVMTQLCQCLANLRLQNELHPLETIALRNPNELYTTADTPRNIFLQQFLVATKQFGIRHMKFEVVEPVPVSWMVDFGRDHHRLRVLELRHVRFTTTAEERLTAAPSERRNGSPGGSRPTNQGLRIVLDKLALNGLEFANTPAKVQFADLVNHIHCPALELGSVLFRDEELDEDDDDESDDEDADDFHYIAAINMSSVEELTLNSDCRIRHFRACLEAGLALVRKLSVSIHSADASENAVDRLNIVSSMISRAVQLKSFAINPGRWNREPFLTLRLRQALNACATVTEICVNHEHAFDFSPYNVQYFERIMDRNCTLARLVASPSAFPIDQLLMLMTHPQLEKCPTGRYLLARCLPEMFAFQKGSRLFPAAKKKSTRNRSPSLEPMRKLRPRNCISYKI